MSSDTSILDSLVQGVPPPSIINGPAQRGASPTATLDSLQPVAHPIDQQAPQGTWGGLVGNFAAGANRSIFGALGGPVDLATGIMNLPGRAANAVAGTHVPMIENPVGGSAWLNRQWSNLTGVNPEQVQPTTEAERMAQGAGGAVAQVPLMAMAGAGVAPALSGTPQAIARSLAQSGGTNLARMTQIAAATGAGGAAGQGLEDVTPGPLKPIANLAGNLAGAGGVMAATEGLRAGGQVIARKAGEMGIGPKETMGGVTATGPQVEAAGHQVSNALGPEGRQIVERASGTEAEARTLESTLADPATPTAERTAAQARLNEIQGRRVNLVPNSNPTTAQIAPTPGAVALEQAHRVAEPGPFNERANQQNNARVTALQGVQPEGNPGAVGQLLRQQLDSIDQLGQQTTQAARGGVQQASGALGGEGTPAQYGSEIRGSLADMNKAAKQRESVLWQAIDPDGTLAMPLGDVQKTAKDLARSSGTFLSIPAQEQQLLKGAAELPNVVPFRSVQQLWSDIGAAERQLRAAPGNDQSLRRLGILKSSVSDAIANAAEGTKDPGITDRLRGMGGGSGGPVVGLAGGRGDGGRAGGGSPEVAGAGAIPVHPEGRPGVQQGAGTMAPEAATDGRPNAPGLAPNFDEAAAQRYGAAKQATLERKTTYGQGPVGATLRPGAQGAPFRVEEASVPRQFLTGNATEPARVQKYIDAVGTPEAVTGMRDALVNDLREKGIVQSDGTIKPDAFNTWMQRRGQTIDLFSGLRDQLGSVRQAQETLDNVTAAHVGAVKEFQNGAARNFLNGDEPLVAVRKAFASGNPTETFSQLTGLVRGNPDAEAGLRRAVVDFIMEKSSSTAPSGTSDIDLLKAAQFRTWVRQNRAPLRVLFGGQGLQTFDAVTADLRRQAQRTASTVGSDTAQKQSAIRKYGLAAVGHGAGTSFLMLLGEHLGGHVLGATGAFAGAVGLPYLSGLYSAMKQAGITTTNDLVREAMLHPELARMLVARVPEEGIGPVMGRRIAAGMRAAVLADMTSNAQRKDKQ